MTNRTQSLFDKLIIIVFFIIVSVIKVAHDIEIVSWAYASTSLLYIISISLFILLYEMFKVNNRLSAILKERRE